VLAPLILLFIAVPIVELYVILQVGEAIGVLPTIALLVADSLLGSILMRSQGRLVWRRFNEAVAAGRPPAREVLDGVLVIFGGAFLLTPGFVTDVFGLIFLLPPTRAMVRRLLVRRLTHRVVSGPIAFGTRRNNRHRDEPRFDVEGTASEEDAERRRRLR
jgi:UPF0716 protein FxsA